MAAENLNSLFSVKKALQIFGTSAEILQDRGIDLATLPAFARSESDNRLLKSWSQNELPAVGEKIGFMNKPARPLSVAVFVTKGGVLKSTVTLNIARLAALHGIRTCVVGLDMQGDVTSSLIHESTPEDESLGEALARVNSLRGLADVFSGESRLEDVLRPTDLPTLQFIPETPELVALDQSLINKNRREYWLREQVIEPLKKDFELILLDCSPNWNRLITNALVACDALVSPLECKINNFRNFRTFRALIDEFKRDLKADFRQLYVPTRLVPSRKLSREIFAWYLENLPECVDTPIRESTHGEESIAMRMSVPEYAPSSPAADEMRELVREAWSSILESTDSSMKENQGYVARTW